MDIAHLITRCEALIRSTLEGENRAECLSALCDAGSDREALLNAIVDDLIPSIRVALIDAELRLETRTYDCPGSRWEDEDLCTRCESALAELESFPAALASRLKQKEAA